MGRVDGKVVLISGGARGMGASHATALLEEGARVVIADVLEDEGRALSQKLGDRALFVPLDVTVVAQWERAVRAAVEHFGGLDVLVNNAGIVHFAPIDELDVDSWHRVMSINLSGTFYGIRSAVSALKLRGQGSIINISSSAGLMGYESLPAYTASKFGIRGLTKAAALDLGRYGIRVNSVHPGMVRTPMLGDIDPMQSHVALHRIGRASEISDVVVFLASDESSFATGAEFVIDGGETAGLAHFDGT